MYKNNIPEILYLVDPNTRNEKVFDNSDDAFEYQGYIFDKSINNYINNNYNEEEDDEESYDAILFEAGFEAGYDAPILKIKLDHETKTVTILLDDDFNFGNDYNISYKNIIKNYRKTLRDDWL